MSRQKRAPAFFPPSGMQAIRTRFLNYAVQYRSRALHVLAKDVYRGDMSVSEWARSLNATSTWLERWAQDTVDSWNQGLIPAPNLTENGALEFRFRAPRDEQTQADEFSCILSGTPLSMHAHRVTIGGPPWWEPNTTDDQECFRKEMHFQLDLRLDAFFVRAVKSGASQQITLPNELDKKLQAAAQYILCDKSTGELHSQLVMCVGNVNTVYRWLREILDFLGLPMRARGCRRKLLK
jgi:hypothetical protein